MNISVIGLGHCACKVLGIDGHGVMDICSGDRMLSVSIPGRTRSRTANNRFLRIGGGAQHE